uniref:G_PROTEIN_RECEP_F1_2 domain-containing protein n=1 Tax=Heterorhabditis bacteriophora TaxID=37862 RepID=A0A1I7WK93_HETBA
MLFHLILICLENILLQICIVDPSLWPELLRKQNSEAIDLLNIPNIYYIPSSFVFRTCMAIVIPCGCLIILIILSLICHMQYILRKQCEHLTVYTQKLQRMFLITQIIQLTIPFVLLFVPFTTALIRILDGRLGWQIVNDILVMMVSSYGVVATVCLIF